MRISLRSSVLSLVVAAAALVAGCGGGDNSSAGNAGKPRVRLGYFPNVTHAQALVGIQRGDFAQAFGDDAQLETISFNAGPSVVEAFFGKELDISYVGPSPILSGFLKSEGEALVVIAGAAENGVLIVGNKKLGITKLEQLKGARIATPQLGNTQDISARHYVVEVLNSEIGNGEGQTRVIPTANPDIENLFQKDQIDAAWVAEPWGSRLIQSGLAVLIAEEKDLWADKRFALTNVVARPEFVQKHPELVKKFLETHARLTEEVAANGEALVPAMNQQIETVTKKSLPPEILRSALTYCNFTVEPDPASFQRFFEKGRKLGFITQETLDPSRLIQDSLLKEVQSQRPAAEETARP